MTTTYNPHTQWRAEELRDSTIDQLAAYQAELGAMREKYLDNWHTEDAHQLIGEIHGLEQKIIATVGILVRRQQLLIES